MDKKSSRIRRARRTRAHIDELNVTRLCVHRTPRHIYAQVIDSTGGVIIAAASSVEPEIKKDLKGTGNVDAAAIVGRIVAERAREKGVEVVAFDRSGFKYHGRIQALADAAREAGLKF